MARRVFFSFHFERDAWRAGQVRNSWVTQDREFAGFWDSVEWEKVKKKGDEAIKDWINKQLKGTSVTVVLIGTETSERPYVNYEIKKSIEIGNGLLGIYIHKIKDQFGKTSSRGEDPLPKIYSTYDWVSDDGYKNFGDWVEKAAKAAGR